MEKIIDKLKNANWKKIYEFTVSWYITVLLISIIGICASGFTSILDIVITSVIIIFSPLFTIMLFVPFIPAFFLIKFIYKKCRNKAVKICSVGFFMTLLNLFYIAIEYLLTKNIIFTTYLGLVWLYLILPAVFIFCLFLPNKVFSYKWQALLITLLTIIFGAISAILLLCIPTFADLYYTIFS